MFRKWLWVGLLLTLAFPAWGQQVQQTPRLLNVTGTGSVFARPDRAIVQLGIETQDKSLQTAQDQNSRTMNRVIEQIRGLGVAERQIRTAGFSVLPIREITDPKRGTEQIVGYRVTNIVTVELDNLSLVGRVVDTALAAGANRVDNISFILREISAYREQALGNAAAEARSKATALAEALGVRLGRIYNITEGGVNIIQPYPGPVMLRAEAGVASTPVFAGETEVRASVTVAYLIE